MIKKLLKNFLDNYFKSQVRIEEDYLSKSANLYDLDFRLKNIDKLKNNKIFH
mgnify:CR=1 FL=1